MKSEYTMFLEPNITYEHSCQNRDLDRKIVRFYDLVSPKHLESH